MRFLLLLLAAAACSGEANVIDAPSSPADASDGGVATDAGAGCGACGSNQLCVAYHDGTCSPNILIECQDRNPLCQGTTCLQGSDCELWHCKRGQDAGTPYICYSCPNDITGALNCHGP